MILAPITKTYRVGHLFCGIGAGAAGFNDANPRVKHLSARFECAGGIDWDAGAIANFDRITGAKGTVRDLFSRDQYVDFHGHQPPADWVEAMPADIRRAHGDQPLDVMFLSAPCKGFSGLLSAKASGALKYQALNELTVRGVWLTLEAYKDDPIRIILFENVPRIMTRGRALLDRIQALLRAYGYVFAETVHNCGEIGSLAQSRNRMLLVARHAASVPPFLYQPEKSKLRGVGEVIGKMPLPGDALAGAMHRVPQLQWKTWVRLAFVPAGKDWRALNELAVENGHLRDFGIVPDLAMRDNQLGVLGWSDTAPTLTGQRSPGQGRFSVADPRVDDAHNETLGVRPWEGAARVVAGASRPMNGAHSVADPRIDGHEKSVQMGVRPWDRPAGVVTGKMFAGGGPNSVADPRLHGTPRFNNVFRIVPFDDASPAVAGPGGPGGGIAVADPRAETGFAGAGKYRITGYEEPAGTVIAGSTTGQGAFALADPRPGYPSGTHQNILAVTPFDGPSKAVTGARHAAGGALSVADPRPTQDQQGYQQYGVKGWSEASIAVSGQSAPGGGPYSVADPRPVALNSESREGYASQGHYGVVDWADSSNAIPAYAKYDRGNWSVADPRDLEPEPLPALPAPNDRLVARIVARDGTWHRPFTTLELAALQSIFDPEEVFEQTAGAWSRRADFDLMGGSDQTKREWIGNAVPRKAARGMATTIGETLLLADSGETFVLSTRAIWTRPLALALSVDPRQTVEGEVIQ